MKVLSGAYTADAGEILLEGKPITRNSPRISEELGIRMIYQELNLVPELSIASNVFLGHELKKGFFVDKRAQEAKADELLRDMGDSGGFPDAGGRIWGWGPSRWWRSPRRCPRMRRSSCLTSPPAP